MEVWHDRSLWRCIAGPWGSGTARIGTTEGVPKKIQGTTLNQGQMERGEVGVELSMRHSESDLFDHYLQNKCRHTDYLIKAPKPPPTHPHTHTHPLQPQEPHNHQSESSAMAGGVSPLSSSSSTSASPSS